MSEYEDRIFETLTSSSEKFKSAYEIANHIDGIKRRLIKTFWENVKEELLYLNEKRNSAFIVHLEDDIFDPKSKCYLYLKECQDVRFQYEQLANDLTMGLWFPPAKIDFDKVSSYREKVFKDSSGFTEKLWWFVVQKRNIDFSKVNSLALILPNPKENSKQIAKELFDFADAQKEHLEYIVENCLIR